jgi:hypothetical protein
MISGQWYQVEGGTGPEIDGPNDMHNWRTR